MVILAVFVFAMALRFVPHVPAIVPISALALYAGACMDKKYRIVLPVALFIATDLVLGLHETVLFTWGSIALIALAGTACKRWNTGIAVGGSLAGALFFFAVTNFGVWLVGRDMVSGAGMYPHSVAGLAACYAAGLPFLVNSLIGNACFAVALTGLHSALSRVDAERSRSLLLSR